MSEGGSAPRKREPARVRFQQPLAQCLGIEREQVQGARSSRVTIVQHQSALWRAEGRLNREEAEIRGVNREARSRASRAPADVFGQRAIDERSARRVATNDEAEGQRGSRDDGGECACMP